MPSKRVKARRRSALNPVLKTTQQQLQHLQQQHDDNGSSCDFSRSTFVEDCSRKEILLEGLIALSTIDNPNRAKVFKSPLSRARFFDALGDIHSIVDVVRDWCNALQQSEQCRATTIPIQSWCDSYSINESTLYQIENWVKALHDKLATSTKAARLKFHKDIEHASSALTETLCDAFGRFLCVYRGHKKLGYREIATGRVVYVDNSNMSSFVNLTNQPPDFVLSFDTHENDKTSNVKKRGESQSETTATATALVSVDKVNAEKILKRLFSKSLKGVPSADSILALHRCKRFTIENIGITCGKLVVNKASKNLNDSVVEYDSDCKNLIVYALTENTASVREALRQEISRCRAELLAESAEFAYPHVYSSLRINLASGFECKSVVAPDDFTSVEVVGCSLPQREHLIPKTNQSDRDNLDRLLLRRGCSVMVDGDGKDGDVHHTVKFSSPQEARSFLEEARRAPSVAGVRFIPSFRHAMERSELVRYECRIVVRARWTEPRESCRRILGDADREGIQLGIERLLNGTGLNVGGSGSKHHWVDVTTQLDPKYLNRIDISVSFESQSSARSGIDALTAFARSNQHCFRISNEEEIKSAVKSVTVVIDNDVYAAVGQMLIRKLDKLSKGEKSQCRYEILPATCRSRRRVFVVANESCHIKQIVDVIDVIVRPAVTNVNRRQWRYLQTQGGKRFVQFLQRYNAVHIDLPEYRQEFHVYASASNRDVVAKLLTEQCVACVGKDPKLSRWNLIDFAESQFRSEAMPSWIQDFEKDAVMLKMEKVIDDFVLDVERMHLWVKSNLEEFKKYTETMKIKLSAAEISQEAVDRLLTQARKQAEDAGSDKPHPLTEDETAETTHDVQKVENKESHGEESASPLECSVCYFEFSGASDSKRYVAEACGDNLCLECFAHQFINESVKENRLPVRCQCDVPFTLADLYYACSVCRASKVEDVLGCALRGFVVTSKEHKFCPRPDCPGVYQCPPKTEESDVSVFQSQELLQCLHCSMKICNNCHDRGHGNKPCGDGDMAMERWMKENRAERKVCPSCKMAIEKLSGCNNVFCVWCQKYSCWACSKFFSAVATEVYGHLNEVHDGIA